MTFPSPDFLLSFDDLVNLVAISSAFLSAALLPQLTRTDEHQPLLTLLIYTLISTTFHFSQNTMLLGFVTILLTATIVSVFTGTFSKD